MLLKILLLVQFNSKRSENILNIKLERMPGCNAWSRFIGRRGGILASLGTSDRSADCMGRVIDSSLIESVSRPSPLQAIEGRSYSVGMAWRSLKGNKGYGSAPYEYYLCPIETRITRQSSAKEHDCARIANGMALTAESIREAARSLSPFIDFAER